MKNVTRRSALGLFVAAGGATLLAACGSQSQASSGSASASGSASTSDAEVNNARADYSGAAVLDGYTSKPADYQLATRTEPAKNGARADQARRRQREQRGGPVPVHRVLRRSHGILHAYR